MNILQLVEESPVLDFSIPVLEELETEDNKIIILCLVPNLHSWYEGGGSTLSSKRNILIFDLIGIYSGPKIIKTLLRHFTLNDRNNTKNIFSKILRKLCEIYLDIRVDVNGFIIREFNNHIDLALLDQRNDLKQSRINSKFFTFIDKKEIKSIFLPASPFVPDIPMTRFPFGDKSSNEYPFNIWPKKFEYWVSNNQPSILNEISGKHIYNVGYSGLDSKWLNKYRNIDDREAFGVLVVIRNFQFNKNTRDFGGPYEHVEILNFLQDIKKALEKSTKSRKYKVYIKSHYYTNWKDLNTLLEQVGFNNYSVLRTNIYNAMEKCSLSIGLHSSVNFVTSLAGIPTILFQESIGEKLFESDKELKEIYLKHPGFVTNRKELENKILELTNSRDNSDFIKKSKDHLRCYYLDNSIEKCLDRISVIY